MTRYYLALRGVYPPEYLRRYSHGQPITTRDREEAESYGSISAADVDRRRVEWLTKLPLDLVRRPLREATIADGSTIVRTPQGSIDLRSTASYRHDDGSIRLAVEMPTPPDPCGGSWPSFTPDLSQIDEEA